MNPNTGLEVKTNVGPQPHRRRQIFAAAMAAPAIVVALGVIVIEVTRWQRPSSPLFASPVVYSLADAIADDDVQAAYGFIRAGQNPNELIAVRHPSLTAGRSVLTSPLLWAVATQKKNAVLMLLGYGSRMERPADKRAACLADVLHDEEIASLLRTYAGALAREQCRPSDTATAPLLSFVESAETLEN